MESASVEVFPGLGGTELKDDAAEADAHDCAELEQLKDDDVNLGLSPFGSREGQATQGFHQGVGQCREVQTQLVALHLVGGEPVSKQAHLLLDAILHLP